MRLNMSLFSIVGVSACLTPIFTSVVSAHCVFLNATGLNAQNQPFGPTGRGLGVNPNQVRDGATIDPYLLDVTWFAQRSVLLARGCGRHQYFQKIWNDPVALTAELVGQNKIPTVIAAGQLSIVSHQINADGGGPFTCMIDESGLAGIDNKFREVAVAAQVAGQNSVISGLNRPFNLVINLPSDLKCTGTSGSLKNICMVRCQNTAITGPFGGCIPVQQVEGTGTHGRRDLKSLKRGLHFPESI
ncbi:hypothetical protein TWF694_008796 [Orbilia ellipsospora]|uniref:Uncharacterized protein n=1 Tax=Orbilia ellipsospora TaxID=2528407 RepID=A0AAV9XG76_9PEZI